MADEDATGDYALVLVGSYLILGKIETRGTLKSLTFSSCFHIQLALCSARTFIFKQKRCIQSLKEKDIATPTSKAIDEPQIRALIDDRVKAVRTKDVNASMSKLAPDILSFDVVNPLQHIGSDASKKRAEEWFSSFQGPIGYEIRDLSITAGDNVAFSHGLSHVNATRTDGGQLDMWWRTTVCFHKIDGKWMITHEHNSVPFDVESGKASLDLNP